MAAATTTLPFPPPSASSSRSSAPLPSRYPRPSEPAPTSPSTPSFPLFSRLTSISFSTPPEPIANSTRTRDRRISFGGMMGANKGKGKGKAKEEIEGVEVPPLKRSKSARTSLISAATRRFHLSNASSSCAPTTNGRTRRTSTREISQPVLQTNPAEDDSRAFMRDYQARAPLFAMSSPELGMCEEVEGELGANSNGQWAHFPRVGGGRAAIVEEKSIADSPASPMIKWRKDAGSSFSPFIQSRDSLSVSPLPPLHSEPAPPPSPIDRTLSSSPTVDEATRKANREEALARLTGPTPTSAEFPDSGLDAFPFPRVATPQADSSYSDANNTSLPAPPPPRPRRAPPAVPISSSTSSHSIIVTSPSTPLSPPPLPRSNTVTLHPSPSVALDIDFRGRLLRARNTHSPSAPPAPPSPLPSSTSIGSDSSHGGSSLSNSSPPSSRFADWSSRRSSETSLSLSINPPTPEKEDLSSSASSSTCNVTRRHSEFYAISDRRHAESAVDVLAIVEEDETPVRIPTRLGGRAPSVKRSNTAKSSVSPPRRSSSKRLSLERTLSTSSGEVHIIPRTRRATPFSAASISQARHSDTARGAAPGGAVETFPSENESQGSGFSIGTGVRPSPSVAAGTTGGGARVNFVDSPTSFSPTRSLSGGAEAVPFPSTARGIAGSPRASLATSNRKPHKRANSELHVAQPLSSSASLGQGIGLGLPTAARTRHESYSPEIGDATGDALQARKVSRRTSGQQAARTKLVLREKGKPTLTYQLGECIGKGQFGTVYRALNLNTGQVVAVKRIQLEGKTEAEIEQLSNEVSLLQRLNHPAIVRYQGLLRSENYLNIILEYAESGSLQTTLRQFGQLPEGLVASYVVKILEGLAYLHEQGVVHCDLKAANILSTKTGNTKLSDFGVSLNLHAIKNTQGFGGGAKDVQGTPNWMAPEVIEMRGALPASDIWSLGCTVVELIDGRPPYSDLVAMSAMFRIVEDENGPPVPDSSSPELKAFLARCFKKDPRERPSATELFEDPWLLQHFVPHQDLRPQDSLPFLRRISGEYQKALSRPVSPISVTRHDSPLGFDSILALEAPSAPFAHESAFKRESVDSNEMSTSPVLSSFAHATEEIPKPHDWIRSSFSRAVTCKLCGDSTKRHAVLCSTCGIISHRKCTEFAPSCDLRAQLLGPKIPLYPAATISSIAPAASTSFSFTDYLPGFSKSRRPKARPTSSDSSLPPTATSGKAATAKRHISNMISSSKSRTPEHTPPSSLTRTYGGILGRNRSTTSVATRRNDNSSGSSIVHLSADDLASQPFSATSPDSAGPLRRKLSNNVVIQTALNARLDKKKSHSRTQSQPINKVKNEGDCVIS
ncbi:hypothetical protein JCM3765_003288 [Sporobolomyces pararoseus]